LRISWKIKLYLIVNLKIMSKFRKKYWEELGSIEVKQFYKKIEELKKILIIYFLMYLIMNIK